MCDNQNNAPLTENLPEEQPKKKRRWKKVLLTILLILVALIAAVAVVLLTLPQAVIDNNVLSASEFEESEVAVTPDLPPVHNVLNIALFGIDQTSGSVGRSDTMMILSIDKDHNKIKLTSLARDSLVPIDGHGEEKLTHAWAYGHAKLALTTINKNFGMNITEYAYVNFNDFIKVIDYVGGVYVDMTSAEREFINNNFAYGTVYTPSTETGRVLLDGAQALVYARNRSDGDSNRTARQREVVLGVYEQLRTQPLTKLTGMVPRILQLCHTTLSGNEVVNMITWALTASPTIETLHMPDEQLKAWNGILDRERGWVRVYDLEAATQVLHKFIYETDTPIKDIIPVDPFADTSADKTE